MSPRLKPGQERKRPGRKPTIHADAVLYVKVPSRALAIWTTVAEAAGVPLSQWVRDALNRAAAKNPLPNP